MTMFNDSQHTNHTEKMAGHMSSLESFVRIARSVLGKCTRVPPIGYSRLPCTTGILHCTAASTSDASEPER